MKIFFLAAIQASEEYHQNYQQIIDRIKALGHEITFDYLSGVTSQDLSDWEGSQDLVDFHKKVITGIKKSDIVVAEVTHQRISTGYWLSMALDFGKPTIAFHREGVKIHFLETLGLNEKFISFEYKNKEDLNKEIPLLLDFASEKQDTRFNFFISPKHQRYLDWVAKNKKVPRSVYLRELIETDMENNEEFQQS